MKRLRNSKGQFIKDSKASEFGFVNLSTYTSPEIKEVSGKEYIEYGADNNYFQYLIDRYNGSPTNNAAINGISQAIYGKGLNATNSSSKPNEYAQMVSLFKKDVVRKLCYDLKLMGQCAIQIIYSKDRKTIAQIEHMPVETLRAEKCNEDGEIPAYYYFKDWANIKRSDVPLRIPAFEMSKENIEILYIQPYKAGFYYYSPVDYQGGLQYAELEEEVSNYHLNNIMNGLSPSMLINFNNGTPNQQERQLIENKIAEKFSGTSNAGKFILAFNDNKESQAEITPVQLSDAHNQYQFLSEESQSKIQVAHRVVSPFLLGIKSSTGFSSNADEIKTASLLMDNTVIRPFQELLIDSFDKILAYNDISLNLYFTTLQPLEFTEVDTQIQDKETIEEETGIEMEKTSLSEISLESFGEDEDLSEWELIDERKVDYESEDALDYQIDQLNTKEESLLSKIWNFARTGTARPNAKSSQDEIVDDTQFKVRYQYAPLKETFDKDGKNVTRDFCEKMVAAKKIYRKEDIEMMGKQSVNAGWGPNGADTYSIWLYKGGGACHHFWMRKTYMKKGKGSIDINSPLAPTIGVNQARKAGFKPEKNDELVAKRPIDMPNEGFLPTNKRR